MVTQDVTLNRQNYLGGSDIAAVMGLSRWKTPLKLWAEKTLKLPAPDLSGVEAVELGTRLEQFVANLWAAKTGKDVRRAPKAYQHPDYDYMVAHVDRLVTGTDELLECKTCSAFKKDEWENDEIPQEYILQVMWYLGITGRKTGHIACLIGGQSFVYKEIKFDQVLFDQMVEAAKEFWKHVQEDTPPAVMPQDDETLQELYGCNGVMIELFPTDERSAVAVQEFETKVALRQELKAHAKDIEAQIQEIETQIKEVINENLGIITPKYKVTWTPTSTSRLDSKALKDAHPEIYDEFLKTTEFKRFTVKANKEVA